MIATERLQQFQELIFVFSGRPPLWPRDADSLEQSSTNLCACFDAISMVHRSGGPVAATTPGKPSAEKMGAAKIAWPWPASLAEVTRNPSLLTVAMCARSS